MIDRRRFLGAAALAVPALLARDGLTGPRPEDWAALARSLDGRLIRPGDAAYAEARQPFNARHDGVRPAAVAYCATPEDVRECLAFARRFGVPVTPRSGGHCYAGWSTGPGLVADVSPMSEVAYAAGRATVGAGARLIDLYHRLAAHGVSVPAGTCPTVGIAGLTLGGGLGVVSRAHGLTCDALESVRIVTADGRVLTCSAGSHPDLFWACRGGGGGNFGVATSFTFRTHPIGEVATFALTWPWRAAAGVLRAWQSWAPYAPDALWSHLYLGRDPGLGVTVRGLYLGDAAGCERLLQALVDRAGGPEPDGGAAASPYLDAMAAMAGCPGMPVDRCHLPGSLPGRNPDGRLSRDAFTAASHLAYAPLTAAGIAALLARVAAEGRHYVLLDALGGAIGRIPPGATAFPHRRALFSVQYLAHGAGGAGAWTRAAHAALRPHLGDHAYVNYPDPGLSGWRRWYYGANAPRLARVKAAYDPDRLFRRPQGV